MKKAVIAFALLLLMAAIPFWVLVQPFAFLPHEKIRIRVPYSFTDLPDGVIPMGETIAHPQAPNGHPGIDFGWDSGEKHEVLSSSSGRVRSISEGGSSPGKYDVEVESGVYVLRYKEMDGIGPAIAVGSEVKPGDVMGNAGKFCDQEHCWFNLHWELASISMFLDRWCPVSYLEPESRESLESLWEKVPDSNQFKSKFPGICSGDYSNKAEG